jgi:hypothetical protein
VGFGGGSIEEYVFARSLGHRSPQSTMIRATSPRRLVSHKGTVLFKSHKKERLGEG